MKFRVLSHAGLEVAARGRSIVFDPWLVGSTYWRSWWNYPAPSRELVDSLKPSFIFLTHIHWDHFQGPSLRKFSTATPVVVPRGHYDRMARDLRQMGFSSVIELEHGESFEVAPGFNVTSYHFNPFLDSALVVEADGVTLLNANDAKIMGAPLDNLLSRHPPIDFVLRSHSSANSRLCYEIVDGPATLPDDLAAYSRQFTSFVKRTGAKYAVPFASNHCHLHRETYAFNDLIQTPLMIEEHFRDAAITSPKLSVMISGSSWSSDDGFSLVPNTREVFLDRKRILREYQRSVTDKLEASYRQEARAALSLAEVERYFQRFSQAIPLPLRLLFYGNPVTLVASSREGSQYFELDLAKGRVRPARQAVVGEDGPIEIHASAFVLRQCMALDLFSHLPISKRVRYRVSQHTKRVVFALNLLFNLYEYDWIPLTSISSRAVRNMAGRWRELLLYGEMSARLAMGGGLDVERYLR